ncbi:MAG: TrpR, YerC/YecD [Rhodospirillaceae bacterium]|nr:TrpR, YerC/YecD [Rhodospirillaceae bacterium]
MRPVFKEAEESLYQTILTLENENECRCFFSDLCTPAELEALIDRWAVVPHIANGLPYRRIHEMTGVSVTTIGRVARFLTDGSGGYKNALKKWSSAPYAANSRSNKDD